MKKVIFMAVLMVFGLALFSGRASMAGETTGEYIDDSTITTKVNADNRSKTRMLIISRSM